VCVFEREREREAEGVGCVLPTKLATGSLPDIPSLACSSIGLMDSPEVDVLGLCYSSVNFSLRPEWRQTHLLNRALSQKQARGRPQEAERELRAMLDLMRENPVCIPR